MVSYISVFDMLKIGVGPSSSHTLGPWKASERFINTLKEKRLFQRVVGISVKLYGSLSLTGKGHATDKAVVLGLCGFKPETIPVENIESIMQNLKQTKVLNLNGENSIDFDIEKHIIFMKDFLPYHSNGIRFTAFFNNDSAFSEIYYSIGGGFIVKENEESSAFDVNTPKNKAKFNITTGDELYNLVKKEKLSISEIAKTNEVSLGKIEKEIITNLNTIWSVMSDSIFLGSTTEGYLPGGLNVKRRAFDFSFSMLKEIKKTKEEFFLAIKAIKNPSFTEILDWVNVFALAVNEVNASLGRVVTAPTNGSAGVIPAVLAYYLCFVNKEAKEEEIAQFLLTAGLIGGLFKNGATISAAAGGCQAEIGVSSAMAAAALTEMQGGSPFHAIIAAEVAMEHHLGLTCDPVAGLVQIPCIERNTMGAIKAINASNIALKTNPDEALISLQSIIETMKETAADMDVKYKETSLGGLALRLQSKTNS